MLSISILEAMQIEFSQEGPFDVGPFLVLNPPRKFPRDILG